MIDKNTKPEILWTMIRLNYYIFVTILNVILLHYVGL